MNTFGAAGRCGYTQDVYWISDSEMFASHVSLYSLLTTTSQNVTSAGHSVSGMNDLSADL